MIKCPHCEYEDGYGYNEREEYVEIVGEHGDFFKMEPTMRRSEETRVLLACPACSKTFIGED